MEGGWAYRARKEGRSRPAAARPDRAITIVKGERMLAKGDCEGVIVSAVLSLERPGGEVRFLYED